MSLDRLRVGAEVDDHAVGVPDVPPEQHEDERRDQQLGLAAAHVRSAQTIDAEIRPQHLGHRHGAVRILMVLENARDGARKREARSVQRVNEARLLPFAGR